MREQRGKKGANSRCEAHHLYLSGGKNTKKRRRERKGGDLLVGESGAGPSGKVNWLINNPEKSGFFYQRSPISPPKEKTRPDWG